MLKRLRTTLNRLRGNLDQEAEDAYKKRDAAAPNSYGEAYANGEAHAYGDAADQVRETQEELDEP